MLSRRRVVARFCLVACLGLVLATGGFAATASASPVAVTGGAGLSPQNGSGASGSASLLWSSASHDLIVNVMVSGLAPGSTHPDHIHAGSCTPGNGSIVYSLNNLVAGANGVAVSATVIPHVPTVHFTGGWYVNVHQGPTLAGAGATPIACGDVSPTQAVANLKPVNGSGAVGHAQMTWIPATGIMVVLVSMQGLAPGSVHPDHIHAGSCLPGNGPIVYSLSNLTANAVGSALGVTILRGVTSVSFDGGWYVNVHQGPTLAGDGATPISCGNVRPA